MEPGTVRPCACKTCSKTSFPHGRPRSAVCLQPCNGIPFIAILERHGHFKLKFWVIRLFSKHRGHAPMLAALISSRLEKAVSKCYGAEATPCCTPRLAFTAGSI